MRVLLVEDDDTIAEPLAEGLCRYGFAVSRVATGAAALQAQSSDMVLLDLGLPDMDGLDVCRRLRQVSQIPIIMLTARGSEADRVVGLELGGDDYLSKPFGVRELVARMRAVGRRARPLVEATPRGDGWLGSGPAVVTSTADAPGAMSPSGQVIGWLVIDRRTRQVWVRGRPVALAPKEFDVLALLAEDPGAVVTRQRLLHAVWGPRFFGAGKTLDFHVASLRRKLGHPDLIETRRGVGFRITVPCASVVPHPSPPAADPATR
ncbi:response regulator transcription factor [Micromonospora sp. NPDC049679]|uniref:response regulator transcription factor n=1 Tax=Micromonospora sp. NPDC049679 TaxID=3155920 RepID=UPI0033D718BA